MTRRKQGARHSLRLVKRICQTPHWSTAIVLLIVLWSGTIAQLVPRVACARVRAADPIPLDEYWRRIDEMAELLGDAGQNAPAIAAAADDLAAVEAVVLPDGQVLPVDNSDLVETLRRDDLSQEDLQTVRARLEALQHARDLVDSQPILTTDQTFVQLEEILSRSEFDRAKEQAWEPSLLQRVLDWLGEKLFSGLRRVANLPGAESLLTLFSIVVTLATLAYIFRDSWRQWAAEGRSKGRRRADEQATLSSSKALERAHVLAAANNYRQAVRYLYLSTLLWLDERRLLHYDAALTNREFLRQVAGHTGLYKALLPVVDVFDQVWYGFIPLDSRGYAAYARQVERVRQVERAE